MIQHNAEPKVRAGRLFMAWKRLGSWLGPGGDGLTLLLSALVLLNVTWLLERAGWEEDLPSLTGIVIAALGLGFVLAKSTFSPFISHLVAGFVGVGVTVGLASATLPGSGWSLKLVGLVKELAWWGQALATTDVVREGKVEFIVLMVSLFWALGYLTVWYILRYLRPWVLVLTSGLVLLIALSQLPEEFYFHFIFYLLASVLLVVHVSLVRRQRDWGLAQVGYSPLAGVAHLGFVVVFGLVAGLVAWKVPPLQAAPLEPVADMAKAPWEFVQDQFSRLFSALPAKKPFIALRWGNTLAFGGPPQLSSQVLFTVESKEARYWRARVYDMYSSQGWGSSVGTMRLLSENFIAEEGEPLAMRGIVTHSVRLNAATDTLFMAGEPVRTSLPATVLTRYNQPQDIFSVRSGRDLSLSQKYTVVSNVSVARDEQLRQAGAKYPSWVSGNYLQLPNNFPRRVRRLSQDITASIATPYDKAIAIRDYLKTYPYNLYIKAPSLGRDGVDYFLFSQKAGYCDYYASAMVTMLRSVGVPARFVVGYATGEWDSGKKAYIVRELHYHSWVEVYFPSYGWVEFEPTPPEAVEFTNQPPLGTPPPLDPEDDVGSGALEEDELPAEIADTDLGWLRWTVLGVILLAAVLSVVAWYRWWGRLGRLEYPAEIYAKMCQLGTLAQLAPQPQFTPLEYAERLSARLPHQAKGIKYIAEAYGKTRYGHKKFLGVRERDELEGAWHRVRYAFLSHLFHGGRS